MLAELPEEMLTTLLSCDVCGGQSNSAWFHRVTKCRELGIPKPNIATTRRSVRESCRPCPFIEFWHIHAMFVSVVLALDLHIAQHFFGMSARHFQPGHSVDNVDGQAKTIDLVLNSQIERRVDVPFFFVTTYMQVLVVGTSVGQAMDQPGITVEVENDRLVLSEQTVEVPVRESVGVLRRGD